MSTEMLIVFVAFDCFWLGVAVAALIGIRPTPGESDD